VPEIGLQRPGIAPCIRQREGWTLGVPPLTRRTCRTARLKSTCSHRSPTSSGARSPCRKATKIMVLSRCPCRFCRAAAISVSPLSGVELRALRRLQREGVANPFVFVSERGTPFTTAVTGGRVLDLGAGSGIVGIAAAKAGAREVIAAEIDRYALAALGLNSELNSVEITAIGDDLTAGPPPPVNLVAVGDLFYERDLADRVTAFLDALSRSRPRLRSHHRARAPSPIWKPDQSTTGLLAAFLGAKDYALHF
jgi:hypothetical protein